MKKMKTRKKKIIMSENIFVNFKFYYIHIKLFIIYN